MIPKVIHQIWIGPDPRPEGWMRTWRDRHPDWGYRLWTDETLAAVPLRTRAKLPLIPEVNGRADVIRWGLLERFGGVFVDADSECVRPLPEEFLRDRFFACYEQELARPGLVACGFMGAVPGHELVAAIVAHLVAAPFDRTPAWIHFGPGLLTTALASRSSWPGLRIHPSYHFLPEHFTGLCYGGPGTVYARHYWTSTRKQSAKPRSEGARPAAPGSPGPTTPA